MLKNYWPKSDAINDCIKNEAETADVSVLLAVHQSPQLLQRFALSQEIIVSDEQALLDTFLTDDIPSGSLLVPITGASGAGKSHMIRWLDAQLRRSSNAQNLHIIRIPKSASMRNVVELILEPLKNDPQFEKIRRDLTTAVNSVNITNAAVTLRAHLENELREIFLQKESKLRQGTGEANLASELRFEMAHSKYLPRLFSDAALVEHFTGSILQRIISRALNGHAESFDSENTSLEDPLPQFFIEDLKIPETVDVSQAAHAVKQYIEANLNRLDDTQRQKVVGLLNSVLDRAIGAVFQFENSTNGIRLEDIILAVRAVLFKDNKELVLLIEDFSALQGIQEVLLNVCITEGDRDGQKIFCVMRTAIALTDGLNFRDTVLHRAQREWIVGGEELKTNEIQDKIIEMVGSYLNAARWGLAELQRLFNERESTSTLSNWVPIWNSETQSDLDYEVLKSFGLNQRNEPLFPFNKKSIEVLIKKHLTVGGRLQLLPRVVINEILRRTLLMRENFEKGHFPTKNFQNVTISGIVARWVTEARQTEIIADRLSSFLAIWGGNPQEKSEISAISPFLFSAFNLPTPSEISDIEYVPPTIEILLPPELETTAAPTKLTLLDEKFIELKNKLDIWADGTLLEHTTSNELRKILMDLAFQTIDWPTLRMRQPDKVEHQWIKIPNSRGGGATRHSISICESEKDTDGKIREGLLGAYRHVIIHNRSWNYPEAQTDYVASAAIVDNIVAQLIPIILTESASLSAYFVEPLVNQARIIGLQPNINLSQPHDLLFAIFTKNNQQSIIPFEDKWDTLRQQAFGTIDGVIARTFLQEKLLSLNAAYQGERGSTPLAIDITRLITAKETDTTYAKSISGIDTKQFISSMQTNRISEKVDPCIAKIKRFSTDITEISEATEKENFSTNIRDIVSEATRGGLVSHNTLPVTLNGYQQVLADFDGVIIADLKSGIEPLTLPNRLSPDETLNLLGSLNYQDLEKTISFLNITNQIISSIEMNVAREENEQNLTNPINTISEIQNTLEFLSKNRQ